MTVKELIDELDMTVVAGHGGLIKEIKGCFIGDLLSVVMGKASVGNVWITIQSHVNIIAVSTLVDMACIIISEGYQLDADAKEKANEENIPVLVTKESSYEMSKRLVELGI